MDTFVLVGRLAVSKTEAAKALGVSVDFFDDHVSQELRCVRRGRRRLYPVRELERWLDRAAEHASGKHAAAILPTHWLGHHAHMLPHLHLLQHMIG